MKIGIFDPYLDTLGGGEKYMLTAASLLSENHQVSISWDTSNSDEIRQAAKQKFDIDLTRVSFMSNIFNKETSFVSRLSESKAFDLIIFLSDGSIPLVSTRLFIHFQFPVEWINGKSLLNKLKMKRVDKIICNSEFTKSFIDRKFSVSSYVLYPPADIRSKKNIKKQNIVLHVGRFGQDREGHNYKKQDVMIDVFKKMVDNGLKQWQFVIAISVKKEDEKNLKTLKMKAQGYPIVFLENVSNSTLQEVYGKAKIYWHASGFGEDLEKHPERAEHFGMATVEAMASGAVPVVINAGGQTEIVEDKKSGFLWNSEEELISKTKNIIENESIRKEISTQAVKRAQKFSKDAFCKNLLALL